jgi:hypothetical protein
MSLPEAEITELVSIKPFSGRSAYGPTFGEEFEAKAYVEPGFRRVSDREGNEVVASAFLVLAPDVTIRPGDQVTWSGQRYEVIDAQPLRQGGRVHHTEVYLKSAGEA